MDATMFDSTHYFDNFENSNQDRVQDYYPKIHDYSYFKSDQS